MITSYATLQTAIADFLMRQDLTSVIPTFIQLAEASIARDLRDWRMEKRAVAPFDEGFEYLPDDWIETIRVQIVGEGQVLQIGPSEMAAKKDEVGLSGPPYYYSHTAGRIEVFPVPGSEGELVYFAKVPALSDSNTSNWLLSSAPDVYLYGSLMHSAPFLQEDGRLAVWSELYAAALQNLNKASERSRHSGPLSVRINAYG